jgi:hypothetical protein
MRGNMKSSVVHPMNTSCLAVLPYLVFALYEPQFLLKSIQKDGVIHVLPRGDRHL